MRRRLVLVRHAKAGDGVPDVERTLTRRGTVDAGGLGRWLLAREIRPDAIVTSPARRTRQTWELASASLPHPPEPQFDERIHHDTVEDLTEVVRDTEDGVDTLVVVGHNPAVEDFARWLITAGDRPNSEPLPGDAADRVRRGFPTCAVAVLDVADTWAAIGPGSATVAEFATPADFDPSR